jgi:hypothetical protein
VNLPPGGTAGVSGLCLDPHDLAIAKYVARREKDILFNREQATRGIVKKEKLLLLLDATYLDEPAHSRIRDHFERDAILWQSGRRCTHGCRMS